MKIKIKTCIVAAGLLAGLGVALLPLSSYAEAPIVKNLNESTVSVKISPVITLDLATDCGVGNEDCSDTTDNGQPSMDLAVSPNMVAYGHFNATVSTNQLYTLSVNAKDGKNKMLHEDENDYASATKYIPTESCSVSATPHETCWGLKLSTASAYSPVPQAISTVYTSTEPVANETTKFDVAVSAGPSIAAGSYSATIVVTAANTSSSGSGS